MSAPTQTRVPHHRIGDSELRASALSLGSWHTYDRMDFVDAVAMLRLAHESGINLFDVGVYGLPGVQPPVFTDVIFSAMVRAAGLRREDYLLSSKLWLEGYDDAGFRPQLENALFRCGVEHADLVILGDLRRDDLELRDLVLDLAGLEKAGLIRAWGVNNWSAPNIAELRRIAAAEGVAGPQIAQLKYSVSRRSIPDGEPFAELFAEGLSMQASDVMEGGILAGNTNPAREVGRDPGAIRQRITDSAAEVAELARGFGATPAQLLIAFTLTHPATATTLFGSSRIPQLVENLGAIELLERVGAAALREACAGLWADREVIDPAGP
ncbi:aldo/keto reductase [Paeniglutamicibacter sp. R2-26]|uniref:aldo/keto reductase n=1 Tax=Paeniglutamicibacter sp. R2-26 TaxID=3144417 RepID=UPI003EE750B4